MKRSRKRIMKGILNILVNILAELPILGTIVRWFNEPGARDWVDDEAWRILFFAFWAFIGVQLGSLIFSLVWDR
jgi:ABC-type Fe3+ transport system permease subunit